MNRFEELFDGFRILKRLIFKQSCVSAEEHASTKLQFAASHEPGARRQTKDV